MALLSSVRQASRKERLLRVVVLAALALGFIALLGRNAPSPAVQRPAEPQPQVQVQQRQADTAAQAADCPQPQAADSQQPQPQPPASQPQLDPAIQACMRKGEEYAAKLKIPTDVHDPFNATFVSPVTTLNDGAFLHLARATGTDKVTTHQYHYSYNRYLSRARFHPLNLLEIGLGCDMGYGPGASMKLWRAFLPCSNISFVEFDRECSEKWRDSVEKEGGGKLYIGSQDDPALLQQIVEDSKDAGGFDVIIDDGSHHSEHQYRSLAALWPTIKPGGIYVIEDLATYWFLTHNFTVVEETQGEPTMIIPLIQRLLHTMACRAYGAPYNPQFKEYCRKQNSFKFSDVVSVDCQLELCVLVKGAPLQYPEA